MTEFLKLTQYNDTNDGPTMYVRMTEVCVIIRENDQRTQLHAKGIDDTLYVTQTPDEILAMMKDDGAGMVARHAVEHSLVAGFDDKTLRAAA